MLRSKKTKTTRKASRPRTKSVTSRTLKSILKKVQPRSKSRQASRSMSQKKMKTATTLGVAKKPTTGPTGSAAPISQDQAAACPEAQFQLAMMRPGFINCRFVDLNRQPSVLPTTLAKGEYLSSTSATKAAKWSVVTLCPMAGLMSTTIDTGVGYLDDQAITDTMTDDVATGLGFASVYGATTFAGKVLSFATTLTVTIQAPEANLAGTVLTGSVSLSVFRGASVNTLMELADTQLDLRTNATFELKSSIQNRALIHRNPTVLASECFEEIVAYAVIPALPAQSLDDGSAVAYKVRYKVNSNLVWWPAGTLPLLNNIAARPMEQIHAATMKQDRFCMEAAQVSSNPKPYSLKQIASYARAILTGAEYLPVIGNYATMAKNAIATISGMIEDPLSSLPGVESIIADANFYLQSANARWPIFEQPELEEAVTNWVNSTNTLIAILQNYTDRRNRFREKAYSLRRRIENLRGKARVVYYSDNQEEICLYTELAKVFKTKSLANRRAESSDKVHNTSFESVFHDLLKK